MEILKGIGEWLLVVLLIIILWKPFWRFVGRAAENAYGKAVAIGGTFLLLIALSLIIYLVSSK